VHTQLFSEGRSLRLLALFAWPPSLHSLRTTFFYAFIRSRSGSHEIYSTEAHTISRSFRPETIVVYGPNPPSECKQCLRSIFGRLTNLQVCLTHLSRFYETMEIHAPGAHDTGKVLERIHFKMSFFLRQIDFGWSTNLRSAWRSSSSQK